VRVGRDPSRASIVLGEARISSMHASLKFSEGALWVCDEGSNNGTFVNGVQLAAGSWTRVSEGSTLAFGPVTFHVVLE
jgi:predicted component of type VI protein secretion system